MFCRVDIKEVQSLKHTFNIESTPTFKILIAEEQVTRVLIYLCSWKHNSGRKLAATLDFMITFVASFYTQIETMAGWSNDGLRCMMERNGCKKVTLLF